MHTQLYIDCVNWLFFELATFWKGLDKFALEGYLGAVALCQGGCHGWHELQLLFLSVCCATPAGGWKGLDKQALEGCLGVVALALGVVMAGTGHLPTLKLLRGTYCACLKQRPWPTSSLLAQAALSYSVALLIHNAMETMAQGVGSVVPKSQLQRPALADVSSQASKHNYSTHMHVSMALDMALGLFITAWPKVPKVPKPKPAHSDIACIHTAQSASPCN